MNKYSYLIKNIGVLTIGNFGTKILSFILIPIYTSMLSATELGVYDIYLTTSSFLIPLLTFNIVDAVLRFALDKKYERKYVFYIGIKRVAFAVAVVLLLVCVNTVFSIIDIFTIHPLYFAFLFMSSLIYNFLVQFSTGIEKIVDVSIAGVLNSVIMLVLNVFFLVFLKMRLSGYFIANILAYFVPCMYLGIRLKIWKYFTLNDDKLLETEMYAYSKPLVFNTIAWWINNVSDRYIVTWLCGVAANGIYSVAYKIPSVLNVFQSIFSQAWTVSAVKEFDKNSGEFCSQIYKAYNCGMVIICSGLMVADKWLAKILFAKEFYNAWKYAPFLMISVVFGALSGLMGGIFSAVKKTKIIASTTLMGASVNTILNICLVYLCGPIGAAIATLISYFIVWIVRYRAVNKIVRLSINIYRDAFAYGLLIIQAVFLLVIDKSVLYGCELFMFAIMIYLYIQDIGNMKNYIWKKKMKDDLS